MHIIVLSLPEREVLGRHLKKSPITSIRLRAQAILLKSQGLKVADIAEALLTSLRTITRWLKNFLQRRIASLFSGYVNNENAAKLTRSQKKEITSGSSPGNGKQS